MTTSRWGRRRWWGDRGAVIVEYALVLSLLLLASLGAIQFLDSASRKEVNTQADCISTRPPPPSCQLRTVTTLPATTLPPTSSSTTAVTTPVTATATFGLGRIENDAGPGGIWDAVMPVVILNNADPFAPAAGVTVRVRVTITIPSNPTPFFVDCVTQSDGTCELRFTTPAPGVQGLIMDFETTEGFPGTVIPVGLPTPYAHL